jgi:CBS domain-containing protein
VSSPSDFYDKQVKQIGYQKFIAIEPNISVLKAAKTMIRKKSRLLVFDNDKLVGIITASDMLRAFRKTDDSPPLDDVISKKIYRCSSKDSVLKVVKLMHEKKIGSVIVEKNKSIGIFTERDLLVHILANNIDLDRPVEGYSSYPLIAAKYGILAKEAASIMAQKGVKRLGLTEDGSLVGIVTARDMVDAYQRTYPTSDPYLEK